MKTFLPLVVWIVLTANVVSKSFFFFNHYLTVTVAVLTSTIIYQKEEEEKTIEEKDMELAAITQFINDAFK